MKFLILISLIIAGANCAAYYDDCKCEKGKWFKEGATSTCEANPTTIANCGKYTLATLKAGSGYTCEACMEGFYKDNAGECKTNPTTVDNCGKYDTDGATCTMCMKDYSLVGATCVKNPVSGDSNYKANCVLYSGGATTAALSACEACVGIHMGGDMPPMDPKDVYYKIADGTCAKGSIQNCVAFQYTASTWSCLKCEKNYALNGSTACVKYPVTGETGFIDKCGRYAYSGSAFTCEGCEMDMVFEGGACVDAKSKTGYIANCLFFNLNGANVVCGSCIKDNYTDDLSTNACKQCPYIPKGGKGGSSSNASILSVYIVALAIIGALL